eukprot:TRINITY_DN29038_c0_g1_i1.p1 TRINITY_DN29038_c0_g1~~TRINITY_DN29038_c0_g1_i1.p1  ORF type:complete len:281 (-),score=34.97 TRINITY_DN29038_c0_g1_i1:268-1017(-)
MSSVSGHPGYAGHGGDRSLAGRGAHGNEAATMAATAQLFARLTQEIEEQRPKNCIHFIVDFLCKHYPEHLHGFASIWQMDPDLERERHEVVNFFKAHKISTAVAAHFTNAGYDTLDTLTTLNKETLVDVEAFNNVKWLPGHKVRLQQIFGEISARVRAYRQQYGNQGKSSHRPAAHASPSHAHTSHVHSYAASPALMPSSTHISHVSPVVSTAMPMAASPFGSIPMPALAALPAPPNAFGTGMPGLQPF